MAKEVSKQVAEVRLLDNDTKSIRVRFLAFAMIPVELLSDRQAARQFGAVIIVSISGRFRGCQGGRRISRTVTIGGRAQSRKIVVGAIRCVLVPTSDPDTLFGDLVYSLRGAPELPCLL